jgi:hypothetical protein
LSNVNKIKNRCQNEIWTLIKYLMDCETNPSTTMQYNITTNMHMEHKKE